MLNFQFYVCSVGKIEIFCYNDIRNFYVCWKIFV
jgi:hypothetical protein